MSSKHSIALLKDWSEKHDLPSYRACTLAYEGWLSAKLGDLVSAERQLRGGLAGLKEAQFEVHYTPFLGGLAGILAAQGRFEEGLAIAEDAILRTERNDVLWWKPEALRIKGEILLASRCAETATIEDCFHRSLDLSKQQGALFWELRGAMSLGGLYHAQGRLGDARDLLACVYAKFTEGFDTTDLQRARGLLARWARE
ncbi:hypothetical protein [Bradyrhizobium sp. dw_78]|uniref:hypothetical protein n=1 Tax=Bradyrhizobium sp. dw_78 TaxID=2719793 RepID=UPI001BD3F755|nr:hypothetical protein [Bradyrhizobium sp. dw_78]